MFFNTYQTTKIGKEFVKYALRIGAIQFSTNGIELKCGKISPYFFNSGLFNTTNRLAVLTSCYIKVLKQVNKDFDVIFGPAYKGIPLAAAMVMGLKDCYHDIAYAYDRKEEKSYGEGGSIVGSNMQGKKVVIIDDTITDGITKTEALEVIHASAGVPVMLLIAFDRMEKNQNHMYISQEFSKENGILVHSIANLLDLIETLRQQDNEDMLNLVLTHCDKEDLL